MNKRTRPTSEGDGDEKPFCVPSIFAKEVKRVFSNKGKVYLKNFLRHTAWRRICSFERDACCSLFLSKRMTFGKAVVLTRIENPPPQRGDQHSLLYTWLKNFELLLCQLQALHDAYEAYLGLEHKTVTSFSWLFGEGSWGVGDRLARTMPFTFTGLVAFNTAE